MAAALVRQHDFAGMTTVVDVGGGNSDLTTRHPRQTLRVIGRSITYHMRTELVIDALGMATLYRRLDNGATILHSDHGPQYTSWAFGQRLRAAGGAPLDEHGRGLLRQLDDGIPLGPCNSKFSTPRPGNNIPYFILQDYSGRAADLVGSPGCILIGFELDLVVTSRECAVGRDGQLYLELLKKVLTNVIYQDVPHRGWGDREDYDPAARAEGRDWPTVAHTMVGLQRLDNVQMCMDQVLTDRIPGDFIETGAWRGGVCIFMRAVLEAYDCADRAVWVADSFQGIPDTTSGSHPLDREFALLGQEFTLRKANDVLAVPMQVVQENFRRYGLLDGQVKFLPGWFKDSLPDAPIDRLAVLRLDGDLYESTMDALENLYPKLATGGFVIVDDHAIPGCRDTVRDFREKHGVEDPIQAIDYTGAYWRRTE